MVWQQQARLKVRNLEESTLLTSQSGGGVRTPTGDRGVSPSHQSVCWRMSALLAYALPAGAAWFTMRQVAKVSRSAWSALLSRALAFWCESYELEEDDTPHASFVVVRNIVLRPEAITLVFRAFGMRADPTVERVGTIASLRISLQLRMVSFGTPHRHAPHLSSPRGYCACVTARKSSPPPRSGPISESSLSPGPLSLTTWHSACGKAA